ncbi:MAG: SDR family NAD(P)-dependent oxidoreductase [Desulfobacterales bacterium]|nr:SDR family NAD(P)-dependent oxidoreductase [Desulfobacteraceae bacterium]MBT4365716.1 SDR family NAD(P)-dependent oxidoreductase [Desulfobacteraceae bacterium]MBT7085969.1 SDR family NAD(P)-dependent oxidoreductase [Desulfobacterales bacterium]MBT7697979.1 SDR family NAD(P)-dependent oxidoreductase [Desulfobacterales bacterium]
MALNLDVIGKPLPPVTYSYAWKDVVLYALGVGAGFSDLDYCYEKQLKVIPSFSIATLFEFLAPVAMESGINLGGMLHGEQELIFHNPIPIEGTLKSEGKITNIYDKGEGKGALIVAESETYHEDGQKLFTSIITLFGRLDGGFGGENAPKNDVEFPDRDPDFVIEAAPTEDQPLLYRLTGDIFDLHVNPEFAKMSGFEKPIMHGLCTHGFVCRGLIEALIPGEPEKARRMACRFSKTLYPGDPIKTLIWKTEDGSAVWRTINAKTDELIIDNGIFEYGDIPKDEVRFDDRVAIVTGAGAGLGRAYAVELAKRGAKVVVNDLGGSRDGSGDGAATPADEVVKEIKDMGGEAVANYDNVATPDGGENVVKTAIDAFGTVDILINNAGILRDKSMVKMEPENWNAVMNVHLNGSYHVTQPAFKVMREKGYGRIIMTTSAAGMYGNFGQTNYGAAKLALVGFMNTLKLEGQKSNIKVNTIAPIAASRLTEDVLPAEMLEKSKPEMVVPMTLYLCSERCPVSGNIYNAGMGGYSRTAMMTGPGAVLGAEGEMVSLEQVRDGMGKIASMKDAKVFGQLNDMMGDLMMAFSAPAEDTAGGSGSGFASATEIFEAMAGGFKADAADGVDLVMQYNISGGSGGEAYFVIKDNKCSLEAGSHDKPTFTMITDDKTFIDMMNGTLPPMQAFSTGKLSIEGDMMKSQLVEELFEF